jgi:hypothetical protein
MIAIIKDKIMKVNKLRLLLLIMIVLSGLKSFGQHLELTAFGGGTFAEGINSYSTNYSKAQIDGSAHYGGTLDFFLLPGASINLTVFDQPTTGHLYGTGTYSDASDPMHVTYILLGGNLYAGPGKLKLFGGFGLGAAILATQDYGSSTKFAVDLHGGVKFDATEHIGFRFQLQLDAPIDGGGYGIGITPDGAVPGVATYSSIVQFGGNIGIVFRFGHK